MCELTGQLAACKVCTAENKRLREAVERERLLADSLASDLTSACTKIAHLVKMKPAEVGEWLGVYRWETVRLADRTNGVPE